MKLLLWPSDLWTKDRLESRQLKELKWWLVDLNNEKQKGNKTREKIEEK
jgi:hypothetical protein